MLKTRRRPARPAPRELTEPTRARILDVAERLFAERGVDAVSVRAILKEAGVNVALAHYHFGSREGLILELLRSRVGAREAELLRAIDEVDARGRQATLEDVLRAYFAPVAAGATRNPTLAKLLNQVQHSANPEVQAVARETMRRTFVRMSEALVKRLPPGITPRQLILRFYMMIAVPSLLSAQWELVMRSSRKRLPEADLPDAALLTEEMVAFCAAGLRAGCGADTKGEG
jgi:AcrR family transcriptional regulator